MAVTRIWDSENQVWQLVGGFAKIAGYRRGLPIRYTTPGTFDFTKGDFPEAVAFLIELVGAGAGGGGASATTATQFSEGGGGGGGAYSSSIVPATDLDTTESFTVGAGGPGGAAGNNAGTAGGDSYFDTISDELRAAGGQPGAGAAPYAPPGVSGVGGVGGSVANSKGDFLIGGQNGNRPGSWALGFRYLSQGGAGAMYGQVRPGNQGTTSSGAGATGAPYGGGGSGGTNGTGASASAGGTGADGLIIVTPLYESGDSAATEAGQWIAWSPTVTGGIAAWQIDAAYHIIDKVCFWRIMATFPPAEGAPSGAVTFTLPPGAVYGPTIAGMPIGQAHFYDLSAAFTYQGTAIVDSTEAKIEILATSVSGTVTRLLGLGSTNPFTWAVGDSILASGSFEIV